MNFNEKLDFLMNLTKTKNSDLAMYTSLDSSYISRLRRGKRNLAKSENYVKYMADYFIKHITESYQRKAILEVLKSSGFINNGSKDTSQILYEWLTDEKEGESKAIEGFLEGFSNFQFKKTDSWGTNVNSNNIIKKDVKMYKGIEGKREGVSDFLSLVLEENQPQTLLLFSDESMEWLTGNSAFRDKWKKLMIQVILKGNKIKIIHTVSRNLYEMLASISEWMPLYMTGAIEPYYYPRKRDGIFKRTMFVAPNTATLTASGVGNMEDSTINYLVQNIKAVKGIEIEFNNYLRLCKPLMKIFNKNSREEYLSTLSEFEKEQGDVVLKTKPLSLTTMPLNTANKIINRINYDKKIELKEYIKKRKKIFEENLNNCKFEDIISIPEIEDVKFENVMINFSNILGLEPVYYKKNELLEHLENIKKINEKYENYNLILEKKDEKKEYCIYCKEDVGVIVSKNEEPFMIFAINEANMTAAFWDFLKGEVENQNHIKNNASEKISEYIEKIKQI